jgi:dihydrofolate reductase
MRKLICFNFVTVNGYFKGPGEDISWHIHDEEGARYSEESMGSGGILIFGRKTYGMMASFWPGPEAAKAFPEVAKGMNAAEKIVISNSMKKATWNNTSIMSGNVVAQMAALKKSKGKDMCILGSGSVITLFAGEGLIDEFQLLVDPVAIPEGTPLFHGIKKNLNLKLKSTRTFKKSGSVMHVYEKSE